jgi:hypothetical protein
MLLKSVRVVGYVQYRELHPYLSSLAKLIVDFLGRTMLYYVHGKE